MVRAETRSHAGTAVTIVVILFLSTLASVGWAKADKVRIQSLEEAMASVEKDDLSGKVVDPKGNAVPGAAVFVVYARSGNSAADRMVAKTKADSSGRFRLEKVISWDPPNASGSYYSTTPFYQVLAQDLSLGFGYAIIGPGEWQMKPEVRVVLHPGSPRTVRVNGPDGEPLQGARVSLAYRYQQYPEAEASTPRTSYGLFFNNDYGIVSAATDKSGQATVQACRGDSFFARKTGFVGERFNPEASSVTLSRSASVSGTVKGPDGEPMRDVVVRYVFRAPFHVFVGNAVADRRGKYVLKDVPGQGSYKDVPGAAPAIATLAVIDPRPGSPYSADLTTVTAIAGGTVTQDIVMRRDILVSGRVVDMETSRPLAKMPLYLSIMQRQRPSAGDRAFGEGRRATTDKKGEFVVAVKPGSEVTVQLGEMPPDALIDDNWRSNHWQLFRGIIDADRSDIVIPVKLLHTVPLSGKVVDAEGKGVQAQVYVHRLVPAVASDATGAFSFPAVPANAALTLIAVSTDKSQVGVAPVEKGNASTTIVVEPTRPYRAVVVTPDGKPVPKFTISYGSCYIDKANPGMNQPIAGEQAVCGADGTFMVKGASPKLPLSFWWQGDDAANRDFDGGQTVIEPQASGDGPIRIVAKPYLDTMLGKVVNSNGEPVAGATLDVLDWNAMAQSERGQSLVTNERGEFTLRRLASGIVGFRVRSPQYRNALVKAASDGVDVRVVLHRKDEPARFSVTVVDDDGKPVSGVPLVFSFRDQTGKSGVLSSNSSSTGTVEFPIGGREQQSYGQGIVICDMPEYFFAAAAVQMDEDSNLSLVLHRGGEHWSGRVVGARGEPIANARIRIESFHQGTGNEQGAQIYKIAAITGKDGRYDLPRFSRKDTINVTAAPPASTYAWMRLSPEVTTSSTMEILPASFVMGRVVDRVSKKPLMGIVADITFRDDQNGGQQGQLMIDGSFFVDGLKPGKYVAYYNAREGEGRKYMLSDKTQVDLPMGRGVEVDLEVEPAIRLKGKLVNAGGGRIVARGDTNQEFWQDVQPDGTWDLYLAPGTYTISTNVVGNASAEPKSITVKRGEIPADLVFEVKQGVNR